MECFIHGAIVGAMTYAMGQWLGWRRGAKEATEYLFERHPQLAYWEKIRASKAD